VTAPVTARDVPVAAPITGVVRVIPAKVSPALARLSVWEVVPMNIELVLTALSPVLVPLRFEPAIVLEAIMVVGVIAPRVRVIAGVVVGLATEPDIPLAVVTEAPVTVPEPPPPVEVDF